MRPQIDPRYNYALSQVFSSSFITRLYDPAYEEDFKRLMGRSGIFPEFKDWDFEEAIRLTYRYLRSNYRCEYVYKNEIANQLLLKYHGDNSATLLREFGLNQSIADVVIVNGRTAGYEIKTELDNLDRLSGQLEDYIQIFDSVYVVTHFDAVEAVRKITSECIGIILLNDKGKLVTEREAGSQCETIFNSEVAARILRQTELVAAFTKYEGSLPSIGSGYIGRHCRNWFTELDLTTARFIFAECLKSRKPSKVHFDLIKNSPKELRMLLLGRELTRKHRTLFVEKFGIFV